MFITFEAGEGAGKSTQARALTEKLRELGHGVVLTREPGGSPLAESLRSLVVEGEPGRMDAETELLIFTAARRDHILRTIRPALAAGKIVVCDRYLGSTHALQGAAGVSAQTIDTLHKLFCNVTPDLTLYLDMDSKDGLERSLDRLAGEGAQESRFEAKGPAFHQIVQRSFRAQCAARPEWSAVDAIGTIPEVCARVLDIVLSNPKFPIRLSA